MLRAGREYDRIGAAFVYLLVLTPLLFALSATIADTLPPTIIPQGAASAPVIPAVNASAVMAASAPTTAIAATAEPSIPATLSPAARAARRPKPYTADSLVLDKSDRTLTLYELGRQVAQYRVALGGNPIGPKQRRGDGRTPEGLYSIDARNPGSKYHLSLHISYPDSAQRRAAAKRGVSPGGDIMIHGLPKRFATVGALHRQQDWTEGCVAVTNDEIEEIWRVVPDGARILIKP